MCAHSSSASEFVEKLGTKLYPFIEAQFSELREFSRSHPPCADAAPVYELVHRLEKEFLALKEFETYSLFPAVQEVFNTKELVGFRPSANIETLMAIAGNKEQGIRHLVTELQDETDSCNVRSQHPLHSILYTFTRLYFDEKSQWNRMVNSWNRNCACFVKAKELQHDVPEGLSSNAVPS